MMKILGNGIDIYVKHHFHYDLRFKIFLDNRTVNRAIIWPKYEDYPGVEAVTNLAKTKNYFRFYIDSLLYSGVKIVPLFPNPNCQYIDLINLQNFFTMTKIVHGKQIRLVYECCNPKSTHYRHFIIVQIELF